MGYSNPARDALSSDPFEAHGIVFQETGPVSDVAEWRARLSDPAHSVEITPHTIGVLREALWEHLNAPDQRPTPMPRLTETDDAAVIALAREYLRAA